MSEQVASPPEGGQGAAQVTPPNGAPPAEAAVSPPAPPPPVPEPYYKSLKDPALRGYAEVKGYKHADPIEFSEALLKSYQNLEKLRGVPAERLLTLPENMDDAEAMKPVFERLGLVPPATAEEYGFGAVEGADPQTAASLAAIAHKHGIPLKQAQAVFADVVAMEAQGRENLLTEVHEETAAELGRLQGEWGAKYESNVETARRAVRQFGFSEAELAAMETNLGAAAMYKRFHAIGQALSEGTFIEGETKKGSFIMTPDAAASERARLMADKDFTSKYLAGDRVAKEKMSRLNQIIAGGQGATP